VLSAERFENLLEKGAAVRVGRAATSVPVGEDLSDAQGLLSQALQHLRIHPELRRLAPDGRVTYTDPILAVAFAWASIAEQQVGQAAAAGADLVNASIWKWALTGIHAWRNRRHSGFLDLAGRTPEKSVESSKARLRIAIVGDAGYSGIPQRNVIRMISDRHSKRRFDYVIHLGDTYFSGGEAEFLHHLLVPFGTIGAPFFTLCGNHDLYLGPDGYTSALKILKQPGRFFMIENSHWRILNLDTSLASTGVLRDDGRLDEVQLEWLERILTSSDPRPAILMSHHFIVSGWDQPAQSLVEQISDLARDRVHSWYWGHEHRCAFYDRGNWGFHGASIGNGAFLEEWSEPDPKRMQPTWYAKTRCSCSGMKDGLYWPHGFLEIALDPTGLQETFWLEGGIKQSRSLRPRRSQSRSIPKAAS
jgi:hypothetical protein